MNIQKQELAARFISACEAIICAEQELTEIDSRFGDADHGITMTKIARSMEDAIQSSNGHLHGLLDDAATAVMMINGGSAVPLWYTFLDGLAEAAPEQDEMSIDALKAMFQNGYQNLSVLSKAKAGDKTMMDTLIPAVEALNRAEGGVETIFFAAAEAAKQGAESTKNFVSKFGRARSYGEETIGTPDAGAMSMMYFFQGLALQNPK